MKRVFIILFFLIPLIAGFALFEGGIVQSGQTRLSVNVLLQIQNLQQEIEIALLKSRSSRNLHFDRLTYLEKMEMELLNTSFFQDAENEKIEELGWLFEKKWKLVEKWKTAHALERNSLTYLPLLMQNSKLLEGEKPWGNLLLNIYSYHLVPELVREKELRANIAELNLDSSIPDSLRKGIVLHASIFLDKKNEVDDLFIQMDLLNQKSLVDQLVLDLDSIYKEKIQFNEQLKMLLYFLSTLLFVVVLIAFKQMVRQKAALASLNTGLEEEVQKRTEKVEQQNKKLQGLNEEKNSLIGIVAHELRSPLNRIKGWLELAKLMGESAHSEVLKGIVEEAKAQEKLIQKILEVETIEKGTLSSPLMAQNPTAIIKEVIESFHVDAQRKEIELVSAFEDSNASILLDRDFFQQSVENLLSNAIKFSPKRKTVSLKTIRDGDMLLIQVIDQGPGLSQKEIGLLFRKYQKLGPRPTGGESSTGLGLSIVKNFVESMDGKVWCESSLGNGATFSMAFPIVEKAEG